MKFSKNNLIHYLLFIIALINFLFVFCIKLIFNKSLKQNVVLTGHKLIGNLEVLFKNQKKYSTAIYFITLNPIYFLKQKQIYQSYGLQNKILCALLPWHIWKYLSSKIIIASHGVYFHFLIVKFFKITTIFCGHALDGVYPVGGNKASRTIKDLQLYKEVWMYSEFEKEMYLNKFEYQKKNLVVTGYSRLAYLQENKAQQKTLKENINLNKKIILYAPTASRNNQKYLNSIFSPFKIKNLTNFEKFLKTIDAVMIIKLHINDKLSSKVKNFLDNSKYLIQAEKIKLDYDYDYLILSDILVTDYSTVYTDYLVLDKPIIFLAPPDPNENWKYTEVVKNKYINRSRDFDQFTQEVIDCLVEDKKKINNLQLKDMIYKNLEIDKIIQNCFTSINKHLVN
jgi:CDP-glycerol glycerophosphotransferase (TagB/SpsB family)